MNDKREFTKIEQACIDHFRQCNADHGDWWDGVYEDFIEQIKKIGLDTDKDHIQFSGFWSQGDGASFTVASTTSIMDMLTASRATLAEESQDGGQLAELVLDIARQTESTWALVALCPDYIEALGNIHIITTRVGHHYSHSGTVRAELEFDISDLNLLAGEGHTNFNALITTFGENVDGMIESLANALYKDLEAEYEDLTSDETVWEMIEANEWFADWRAEHWDEDDDDDETVALAA